MSLDGDTQTQVFTASGDASVIGVDQVLKGDVVTVDFKHNTFRAEGEDVDLRPSFFPVGRVLGDVYVTGHDAYGSRRELFGDQTLVTTCNLPDPHFALIAKSTDIRPGRRIVMRHVQLWILGHHILDLPYLSIPLDQRSSRYTPEVGNSPSEGYFVKLTVPIPMKGNDNFLDSRFAYYSKLGTGLGADYQYRARNLNGLLKLDTIFGQTNQVTFTGHHDQRFGPNELTFDGNFQRGNYLTAPDSTLLDTRATFNMPQRNGSDTRINLTQTSNSSPGFSSLQQVAGLNDTRNFGPLTHTSLDLTLTNNTSSFNGTTQSQDKELDVHFDGTSDLKKAVAELEYLKNIPIGSGNTGFFSSADKTPVFTLRSDASRLLSKRLAPELPFQLELSTGEFSAPSFFDSSIQHIERTELGFNFQKPDHPEKRFDVSVGGRFQQGIYSDDTAQYTTGLDLGTRYDLGRDSGLNLHYNYLQQHGFTPLEFDNVGRTNIATGDLSFRPVRSLLLGAQTGYDFTQVSLGQTPWQSLGIRSEWTPASYFQLRGLATYDTFQKGWSNIRFDIGYKPGATFVSAGILYDGIRNTLGDFNMFVDGFKWGRLKTSLIFDYNGYIKQLSAAHFSFTYDLHCAEAILQILDDRTGFRPGTQIGFYIRLKAFPFSTPFGIGNRGQVIGGGTGRDSY